mmetsp:Transcript_3599/g.7949  ORF Transcript_3599/g.7949 Transcript_3599/m.7949 type:complete len:242 (+) Transcript_3599:842-1567(+)
MATVFCKKTRIFRQLTDLVNSGNSSAVGSSSVTGGIIDSVVSVDFTSFTTSFSNAFSPLSSFSLTWSSPELSFSLLPSSTAAAAAPSSPAFSSFASSVALSFSSFTTSSAAVSSPLFSFCSAPSSAVAGLSFSSLSSSAVPAVAFSTFCASFDSSFTSSSVSSTSSFSSSAALSSPSFPSSFPISFSAALSATTGTTIGSGNSNFSTRRNNPNISKTIAGKVTVTRAAPPFCKCLRATFNI